MAHKRCFVISPIGPEGSDVRSHADDLFDYIIRPAMDQCDIDVVRSDQLKEPGKITDQMFRSLMSDFCIAVLTGHNPNVFYELAIAQAAGRPVIILMEKGSELPFDIEHLRCVYYDLQVRPVIEGVYRDELVAHVRTLEQADWAVESPFGQVSPLRLNLTERGFEVDSTTLDFFETASAHSSSEEWTTSVQHTTQEFELLDFVPFSWDASEMVRRLYIDKAVAGCRIRFLTAHPDNPALPEMYSTAASLLNLDEARAALTKTSEFFSRLAREDRNIEYRQLRNGLNHLQLTRLDDSATFMPYLNSKRPEYQPLWRVPRGHVLYRAASHEFNELWEHAVPVAGGS